MWIIRNVCVQILCLDGLDLEVKSYQGEDQTLEVLDQVVECPQAFWISAIYKQDE